MNAKKSRMIIISVLFVIEIISVFLMFKSSSNKETILEEVKLRETVVVPDGLAIMLETENADGTFTYKESDNSNWPTTGYKYNSEKSGCIDKSGNKIDDALSYNSSNNMATVSTGVTSYCYIYFDIKYILSQLCSSGDNLGECLTENNEEIDSLNNNIEGGLYRYQGTNEIVNDNYICFGTNDKEECTSNTDAYMYRIIGIDENNQLKLIKKEALNETMQWHNTYVPNTTWPESDLYKGLNGISGGKYSNLFIGNATYMPSGWSDKIADYDWKYGDNTIVRQTASSLYNVKNEWLATTTAKIGLMYAYDYAYGMSGGNNCSYVGAYNTCKTSWIFITNNDSNPPLNYEWIMYRYGQYGDGRYAAWRVEPDGYFNHNDLTNAYAVRPVFYLNADEQYISGDGTLDNPIMLGEPELTPIGEYLLTNPTLGLDTTTAYGEMYRYIGTTANNYVKIGDVLYRIIGVTSAANSTLGLAANQVKVIKAASIGTHNWHSSYSVNATWNTGGTDASMYLYLNDLDSDTTNQVLSNTSIIPSGWSDKIDSVKWNIGDVQTYTNGDTVYGLEDNTQTTNTSKVGLMYLSDYYYAYNAGGTRNCYSTACTNWLTDTSNTTWTMSRYGGSSYYNAWDVRTDGGVNLIRLHNELAVRPVFYLSTSVNWKSGTGASGDPFIIE